MDESGAFRSAGRTLFSLGLVTGAHVWAVGTGAQAASAAAARQVMR